MCVTNTMPCGDILLGKILLVKLYSALANMPILNNERAFVLMDLQISDISISGRFPEVTIEGIEASADEAHSVTAAYGHQ